MAGKIYTFDGEVTGNETEEMQNALEDFFDEILSDIDRIIFNEIVKEIAILRDKKIKPIKKQKWVKLSASELHIIDKALEFYSKELGEVKNEN